MTKTESSSEREIRISRVIAAPRERVWRALTDPREVDAWWGPDGFRNKTESWDFKVGGIWRHVMLGPDGARYPNETRFVEIAEPERIVYANSGQAGEKNVSFTMTWTLKDLGGKTELTIRHEFKTRAERDFVVEKYGAIEGGKQTLARLDQRVAAGGPERARPEFELVLERVIAAPIRRVWDAWAKPEELARWFAPKPLSLRVLKNDLRAGGEFKMAMVWPDGQAHEFGGTYLEVVALQKIDRTGEFPGDPKGNIRTEVVFEDLGAKTRLKVRQTFAKITPVNKSATEGAKQGWTMTLDQLGEFCAEAATSA